jgi:peptidoglycan L-alanyl-D-glutamate endopeptidase CwlK
VFDHSVVSGVRGLTTQREYVALGVSKTMDSMHIIQPDGYGHALDLAPYPIDWSDTRRFDLLAGYGLMLAHEMGIPIRWGGDWDRDTQVKDQKFNDLGHFELHTPIAIRIHNA